MGPTTPFFEQRQYLKTPKKIIQGRSNDVCF